MSEPELPEDQQELFALGLQLLDKDFFLGEFCPRHGVDRSELFAKARFFASVVDRLRATGRFLFGMPCVSRPGPRVTIEDHEGRRHDLLMFASNDYLGMSTDPAVHEAVREALDAYGIGAGSSRVNIGYSGVHRELEAKIAERWGKEAALVFPTGFDAVASTIESLCGASDRIVVDASSHAAIMDGARRSGATMRVFRHNDTRRLEAQLARAAKRTEGAVLVVVEGAYSMDGDIPPLDEMVALCERYGASILVDEAHAIGVVGERGHGAAEHFGVQDRVDLIAGTFSKSLGATGGFVAASREAATYLNYLSTRIVFSAAFPPILARGVSRAIDRMEEDDGLRARLWENIGYFADGFRRMGMDLPEVRVGAIPLRIHRDEVMVDFAADLFEAGVFSYPIVYPSVPHGRSMFRLAMQSGHTRADLDYALEVFEELLRKYEILP